MMSHDGLREAEEKMRAAGQAEEVIRAFRAAYQRLAGGERGLLPSAALEPVAGVRSLQELDEPPGDALAGVAVIKLNGGLATTMGLRHPKSLLEARDGHSFLDLIVRQVLVLRDRYGVPVPLLFLKREPLRTRSATPDASAAAAVH